MNKKGDMSEAMVLIASSFAILLMSLLLAFIVSFGVDDRQLGIELASVGAQNGIQWTEYLRHPFNAPRAEKFAELSEFVSVNEKEIEQFLLDFVRTYDIQGCVRFMTLDGAVDDVDITVGSCKYSSRYASLSYINTFSVIRDDGTVFNYRVSFYP